MIEQHFGHFGDFDYVEMRSFQRRIDDRLPTYQPLFESAAGEDIDWRLLAAISYQESHWDPDARSPTGVRGLMMLTNDAAKQLGVEDRTDPVQSINGGTVSNSVSRMTVTGDNRVGGLIAVMNGGVLEDSYFEGDVSGTFWIAGLVAETWSTANPLVQRSYASGTVTAASSMWGIQGSGLVAYDATGVVVVDAGWDTQTTTQMSTSGSGTAMTTAEMQTPTHATFTNWGLPWVLVAGDYPRLDWE